MVTYAMPQQRKGYVRNIAVTSITLEKYENKDVTNYKYPYVKRGIFIVHKTVAMVY